MQFDDILGIIGEFGKYQKIKFTFICLVAIISAFLSLNMVFVGGKPEFQCKMMASMYAEYTNMTDVNLNVTKDQCMYVNLSSDASSNSSSEEGQPCTDWTYSKDVFDNTIVSEWDLVCDRKSYRELATSIFFAGRLVGAVTFGALADRFGRKPMFLVALVVQVLSGVVAAVSPSLIFFYCVYFLQGVMQVGVFLTVYVMGTELVGPSYRTLTGFLVQSAYSVGYMLLPLLAYFIRNWRYLELAISLPALLFLSYYWLVPESVRWLLSRHRFAEARKIIEQAATVNNVQIDEEMLVELESSTRAMSKNRQDTNCWRCFLKSPVMRPISLIVWFNWIINALVYYGLALNSGNIGGSVYLNMFLAGAVEIPAYILCVALLDRVGRRLLMVAMMMFGGVTCALVPFIPAGYVWIVITLSSLGKFGITASYAIIYLYAAEIFPTSVRNTGMGIASMSARIGGMIAPQILLLGEFVPSLPLLLFGGLSILGASLILLLPETLGKPMPETVDDVRMMINNSSSIFKCRKAKQPVKVEMDAPINV